MVAVSSLASRARRGGSPCDRAQVQPCVPAPAPADLALPAFDLRATARRAVVPAAVAGVAAVSIVVAGGPMRTLADALSRALDADWRWVGAAAGFEIVSFAGYVALLWLVAGRATARMGVRESVEVTLAGAAATRLVPTGGVGGAALTLFALRRAGLDAHAAGRTLLTFLVLLYAVFTAAIGLAGALLALAGTGAPVALTALPAALAGAGLAVALALGLTHRRGVRHSRDAAGETRLGAGARLMGEAVDDALRLLASGDARLLGAVAWWAFDGAVLWAMLDAFGAHVALLVVVLAYFVGQAGNLVPVPGAVSGGIAGILLACGVDADVAIVSVLGYRAVAIWLPAPIGLAALASLRTTLARWGAEHGRVAG